MRFKFLLVLLLSIILQPFALQAKERRVRPIQHKKYKLSVVALLKNEERFIKEWIEYHRLVGVDHFYLYDIGCTDRTMDVIRPYIRDRVVTFIDWPIGRYNKEGDPDYVWALSTQVSAYENAVIFRAVKDTKWLVCLDVDEFLVPPYVNNLTEILERYESYPGVSIPSNFFDASGMNTFPKKNLVIQTTDLTAPPVEVKERSVAKMIFKPELCYGFDWPPYQCRFKDNQTPICLTKNEIRINHYVNRYNGYLDFGKSRRRLHVDNRMMSDEDTFELLSNGYEIDDQERAIERFTPELLKKMGYHTGWDW